MVRGPAAGYPAAMKSFRSSSLLLLLAAACFALVSLGCQTSKGFGKDVENLGDKIQEKAE